MRATRVLAIAAILGIAFSFRASANVVYDSETTNMWFNVDMSTLKTEDLKAPLWAPPRDGEATVENKVIKLDTDLDDPLTYTAAQASEAVAIVAAEMTATVNASVPDLVDVPQAALCVIGTASATNWVGLIGDGKGGTTWVTFPTPVPVAGNPYSVRIEFDQRQGKERRIRYLVDGSVLSGEGSSDGWYPNPKADAAKIRNVSFSGSGDIKALAGENILENAIAFNTPTQTDGFDYTNGAISVSAAIRGYTGVTATLTVTGTDGQKVKVVPQTLGSANWSWDLNDLTQGGAYAYTIEAKDAGGNVIATKTGTFTAAKWGDDIWFGADASKTEESRVTGGYWVDAEPTVEDATYVIDDGAVFNVADQKPGSNHVARVDTKVTFETLVDSNALEAETDALGGFVVAKSGETPQWMALTKNGTVQWVVLSGDVEPEVNVPYVIRAEVDSISEAKCVRYFVSKDDGVNFVPLTSDGTPWIAFADASKGSLAKVELKGSGKVAKFEATVADKALAVVGGVEYDSMDEALAAAKDGTKSITLLTNATVEPTEKGSYDIAPGAYQYVSGGKVSSEERTIVVTEPGEPPVVRPSNQVMADVRTPAGKPYKNINSLREFLERNNVADYQNEDATSGGIENALRTTPQDAVNNLKLWQDYALGIDKTDPVDPVTTPAGDTDENNITLAIPAIDPANYSDDYIISYQINGEEIKEGAPQAIKVPLKTDIYTIKVLFTPAN